ncbi:hypothetical protein ACHAPC_010354 [Botrytis cinerea]
MLSSDISRFDVVAILGTSILIYCILGVVYRLYFHPLSRFPGPLLPAVTLWSEFYYECIQSGQYFLKIAQWHEKYGPIIRIGPNEIHVSDPEYYNTLFSYNAVRNKDPFYTAQFNTPDTEFGAEDHYVHRMRRSALNPFFSKASIDRLSPMLTSMVSHLSTTLSDLKHSSALSGCLGVLLSHQSEVLLKIRTQIREILSGNILPVDIPIDGFPRTIFHNFLSSSLPDSEKKFSNMSQEAINIIGAGTDTTAHALMILMYYLAIDAVRYEKLREELRGVGFEMREDGGEDGGFKKLELGMVERLVYLNACALEGLRLV